MVLASIVAALVGQTTSPIQLNIGGKTTTTFGKSACADAVTVTVATTLSELMCGQLKVFSPKSGTCSDEPGADDVVYGTFGGDGESAVNSSVSVTHNTLPIFKGDGKSCPLTASVKAVLCAAVKVRTVNGVGISNCDSPATRRGNTVEFNFDGEAPTVPNIDSLGALDGRLTVALSNISSDVTTVVLRVTSGGATSGQETSFDWKGKTLELTGLTNDVEYTVEAKAIDAVGLESAYGAAKKGTPVTHLGFADIYEQQGGGDFGGCNSTGLLTSGALLLAAGVLRRRRSTQCIGLGLVAALAVSTSAQAQTAHGSDRVANVELRFASYLPNIDRGFAAPGPYATVFGDSAMLRAELLIEGALALPGGFALVGVSGGYAEKYGRAKIRQGAELVDGSETTALKVMPFGAHIGYRFSLLADEANIPLIPYGRVGVAAYQVKAQQGGVTALLGSSKASTYRTGYTLSAGVALSLNFLEPDTAANFDASSGVNRSYVFAEYQSAVIDSFGKPGIVLSDNTMVFGLGLEL